MRSTDDGGRHDRVRLPDITVAVTTHGTGTPVLLLHGFPHTKEVWQFVATQLVAAGHRVVTPDLRGMGETSRSETGYGAASLAQDQVQLLDALGIGAAHVVGLDAGAAPAFAMATGSPERVQSLTIVEAVIGGLAGAESFAATGGPWWFGFHQAPGGLAERAVAGNEDAYIRFFLDAGSRTGVPDHLARRIVAAHTGRERLRAAFEHYRAMPDNAVTNRAWAEQGGSLTMAVTAVGASTLGDVPARQLERIATDFVGYLLPDSGHIVPVDAPDELARIILATIARGGGPSTPGSTATPPRAACAPPEPRPSTDHPSRGGSRRRS
ncbi:alpha/beta fold hydrolase [Williamsia sterculiae]|uniref:Pimeloyl-ACP methyl ester carboxylesterase n=1 Tax=Williamsia sterculiae TaxID=1344003 RepID=A0A1N7CK81_9NOCA|nr:alpha/beta fold hydrolase [Williamsia sterculiae]SIR63980.1 Pimeloyl-ACP methyl ester carboxylesterase [Williamsia sterculiae]